jgi:hypothetical protein
LQRDGVSSVRRSHQNRTSNSIPAAAPYGWLLDQCGAYAKSHPHPEARDQTIWEMFEAERPNLVSYTGGFDGFHAVPASVSKNWQVRFDNNKYSVAASAVGRPGEGLRRSHRTASGRPAGR